MRTIIYINRKYPSQKEAQDRYYARMKNTEDYKERQRQSSSRYYQRNRDVLNAKRRQAYAHRRQATTLITE